MSKFKLPQKLVPLKGVFYFFVILLVSHFFWKFTMLGDESNTLVTFFGVDLTAGFNFMVDHVAQVVYKILIFWGYPVVLEGTNIIRHDNDIAVRIVWACTGNKQA